MNQIQTISAVSKTLGISSRMLRYYEKIGLIKSQRMDNYAYRAYDNEAISRLRQIIILRKLRVPVKQIHAIFDNSNAVSIIEIFERNISELDEKITALATVRSILGNLVLELHEKANVRLQLDLLGDSSLFAIVDSISLSSNTLEKNITDLNSASDKLNKLEQKDIRIIYLPPSMMASAHYIGEDCEMHAYQMIEQFIKDSDLLAIKPDLRMFSFNNADQQPNVYGAPSAGYEIWVTVPDDMKLPEPIRKKKFHGGLYAAHCIHNFEFDHWGLLVDWINNSDLYESDWGTLRCDPYMQTQEWAMEETLNIYNRLLGNDPGNHQLDLLFPIKIYINGGQHVRN